MKHFIAVLLLSLFSGSYCLLVLKTRGPWNKRRNRKLFFCLFSVLSFLCGPVFLLGSLQELYRKLWRKTVLAGRAVTGFRSTLFRELRPVLMLMFTLVFFISRVEWNPSPVGSLQGYLLQCWALLTGVPILYFLCCRLKWDFQTVVPRTGHSLQITIWQSCPALLLQNFWCVKKCMVERCTKWHEY